MDGKAARTTHGSKSVRERARRISDGLRGLFGRPALTLAVRGGGLKVAIRTDPSEMTAEMTTAVLRVLAGGDAFGHDRVPRRNGVWSEVRPSSEEEVEVPLP